MKIEQIDEGIYSCNLSDDLLKEGIKISYSVNTFGKTEKESQEKIMVAMVELLLTIEEKLDELIDAIEYEEDWKGDNQ